MGKNTHTQFRSTRNRSNAEDRRERLVKLAKSLRATGTTMTIKAIKQRTGVAQQYIRATLEAEGYGSVITEAGR